MSEGYLYCARNPYMLENIYKIGCTARNEKERLSEANSNTWSIPAWTFLIVKRVAKMDETERLVHKLLASFELRITDRREFFQVPFATIQTIFDLITEIPMPIQSSPSPTPQVQVQVQNQNQNQVDDIREMYQYFNDGIPIMHRIASGHEWLGQYNLEHNKIIYELTPYDSLTAFAKAHVRSEDSTASGNRSGWTECKTLINGEWRSVKELPRKS
jgi:hypothetical protein